MDIYLIDVHYQEMKEPQKRLGWLNEKGLMSAYTWLWDSWLM